MKIKIEAITADGSISFDGVANNGSYSHLMNLIDGMRLFNVRIYCEIKHPDDGKMLSDISLIISAGIQGQKQLK